MRRKGFTLIELLVVIAIVAALSVVVILALNPAELLRQSRDASRMSDLTSISRAISFYLTSVAAPSLGTAAKCYTSNATTTAQCGGLFTSYYSATNATTSRGVAGVNGWVPVNFTAIPSGAPFSHLPIDPVNDTTYYYAYAASTTSVTFELDANMESAKYRQGGAKDAESTDGGSNAGWYETGTAPGRAL